MGQSDSFINEVSEEVRRDRLYGMLRRYGWLIAAALLLVVGGAAFLEWRKSAARAEAEAAGDALRAAFLEADPAKRAERLDALAADTPASAAVARMAQAGSLVEAGRKDEAAAVLATLADAAATPELYRAMAALQRVMILGPAMDATERRATIENLAAEGAPFRPLALEQRALLFLEAGDKPAAVRDLESIIALPDAPQQLVARARQLIIAAGGTPPSSALPAGVVSGG